MRLHRLLRGGLFVALLVGIAGCSEEGPLQPAPPGGGSTPETGPEILTVSSGGSTRYTIATASMEIEEDLIALSPRGIRTSAKIDGAVGGRLQCGRYVLAVPAGAFDGTGTVTMTMSDSTVMVVDLAISPIDLNVFKEKVKLCLITSGLDVDENDLSIYYFDPNYDDWKAMGCYRDLSIYPEVTGGEYAKGLLTELDHFSKYSGGKAGW